MIEPPCMDYRKAISRTLRTSWIAFALSAPAFAAQGSGTLCLVPGGFDDFAKGGATVEAEQAHREQAVPAAGAEAVRFVQVDRLAPVRVTSRTAGRITGIPASGKHTVRIAARPDMTGMQATFRFSFAEQKSHRLCLWYETFYGSWQLGKSGICHCR